MNMNNSSKKRRLLRNVGDSHNAIFSSETMTKLSLTVLSAYQSDEPFPHGHIYDVFKSSFLLSLVEEINKNLTFQEKECDLYHMYQSINLTSEHIQNMPNMTKFLSTLISRKVLSFIERMNNLPKNTLTRQVDCAVTCHTKGCYLLCHDDVITTRCISYIIYLTENWEEKYGGKLELYEKEKYIPHKRIVPRWNSLVYFRVIEGVSLHAVEEVAIDNITRMSIQGWYHSPPEKLSPISGKFYTSQPLSQLCDDFSHFDRKFLSSYIHPTYLSLSSIQEMHFWLEDQSTIQLQHFLTDKWKQKLECLLWYDKQCFDSRNGHRNGWKELGPVHEQRFLSYQSEGNDTLGSLLSQIRRLFISPPFIRWLCKISNFHFLAYQSHVRKFRPGLDYTLAHEGLLRDHLVLDVTLCLIWDRSITNRDNEGIQGGYECYIDGKQEDTYKDHTELIRIDAQNNSLNLVVRDPGTLRFVKYIEKKSISPRWDVAMEYIIKDE